MRITSLLLLFMGMMCLRSIGFSQTTLSYTESSSVFANPERGLQKYSITDNNYTTSSNYSNLSSSTLSGWRTGSDKVTVIFRYFLLNSFMSSTISATYLSNIQLDFDRIRASGLKCIVRFSYSNAEGSSAQQPVKSMILQHLQQLAPVLETNKDIIVTHQAGFIGTWGEWYYTNSTEFGTDGSISSTQWQNRKQVVDAMLAATPVNIPIQLRYPQAKKAMYGSTTLTAATAYQNTAQARIGFFNDAFLNEWGDMGTYNVGSQTQNPVGTTDYTYLSNETKYTPMMGETNGLNAPRTNGANALLELDLTNWSTLNRDYYAQNFTNWINSGHYTDILRKLGYRYVLNNSKFTNNASTLNVEFSIKNVGYARLFKARQAQIVLKNTGTGVVYPFVLLTDPRTWEGTFSIVESINISSLPVGTYEAYLNLPDSNPALALRPEYSIQFANENVWEASTGYNKLSQTVVKTGITLRTPENPANTVLGVNYNYYQGSWNVLPNFAGLQAVKTGTSATPDLSQRNRDDQFGFSYTGYVNVPADGSYTFYTSSDDGSQLYIGSALVVNNDGLHGVQEASGTIGLKAGKHAIRVVFFEQGGGQVLSVSYAGPGITKQVIPASAYYRVATTPPPNVAPTISLTAPGDTASFTAPASMVISANASDSDGSVAKVDFYNGSTLIFSDVTAPYAYTWSGITAGSYTLSAKATDNSGASTTTASITVTVQQVISNTCSGIAQYVENGGYTTGSKVQEAGNSYECKPWPYSGWCNGAAWAYKPGTGAYWTDAWTLSGSCAAAQSSAKLSATENESELSNSPNPFSTTTTVEVNVEEGGMATVKVYDKTGKEVAVLNEGYLSAGIHRFEWNSSEMTPDLYVIRYQNNRQLIVRKIIKLQ
ncbi:MAG: hypothetical protein K0R51_2448 [Cytophagaceae bacterium]|jgi:hypothetical protein|nr:hypothetical protein [Cytophagaceae bacterium]